MKYKKITQIAKGWSSYIWLCEDTKGNKIALKEVREKSPRKNLFEREGKMLSLANTISVGPKLIEANKKENFVAYKFVEGKRLLDWVLEDDFENVSAEELHLFIKEPLRQCLALDSIGLSHNQLQVGKNILVSEKTLNNKKQFTPTIIDFEKATLKGEACKRNEGQVLSFLLYNPNGAVAKKVREKLNLTI